MTGMNIATMGLLAFPGAVDRLGGNGLGRAFSGETLIEGDAVPSWVKLLFQPLYRAADLLDVDRGAVDSLILDWNRAADAAHEQAEEIRIQIRSIADETSQTFDAFRSQAEEICAVIDAESAVQHRPMEEHPRRDHHLRASRSLRHSHRVERHEHPYRRLQWQRDQRKGVVLLMNGWMTVGAALAAAALTLGLSGCIGGDSPVLVEGETRTSPSGEYISEFLSEDVDGKTNVYPVIKNSTGEIVWADDQRYLMSAHPVAVVWQEDDDVLWLLSSDIGSSRVVNEGGTWSKDWNWTLMPDDIQRIAGRR